MKGKVSNTNYLLILAFTCTLIFVTGYLWPNMCYLIIVNNCYQVYVTWNLLPAKSYLSIYITCFLMIDTWYVFWNTCYLILVTCHLLPDECYMILITWHLLLDTFDLIFVTWYCFLILVTWLVVFSIQFIRSFSSVKLITIYMLSDTCYPISKNRYLVQDGFKKKIMEFSIKGPDPASQHP